jgi:hypothetical protein
MAALTISFFSSIVFYFLHFFCLSLSVFTQFAILDIR